MRARTARVATGFVVLMSAAGCELIAGLGDHDLASGSGASDGSIGDAGASEASSDAPSTCGDTTSSAANCGACGHACDAGVSCTASICNDQVLQIAATGSSQTTYGGTSCAVLHDGTVWCWGGGALNGMMPPDAGYAPVRIESLANVAEIALGDDYGCARMSDGSVKCWGNNSLEELGHATGDGDDTCSTGPQCRITPAAVALPNGASAKRIYTAGDLTCAITTTNDLDCWGQGANAVLEQDDGGLVVSNFGEALPTTVYQVPAGTIDLDLSASSACLVNPSGQTQCWGINSYGALGHQQGAGTPPDEYINSTYFSPLPPSAPIDFRSSLGGAAPYGNPVQTVHVSQTSGCVLGSASPLLACWGTNVSGNLGIGSFDLNEHGEAVLPANIPGIRSFAVTVGNVFAIDVNGIAWGWGSNIDGSLGTGALLSQDCGNSFCETEPVKTILPANVAQILPSGINYALALGADGTVWGWGANATGQLGHTPGTGGDLTNCLVTDDAGASSGGGTCNPTPTKVIGLP